MKFQKAFWLVGGMVFLLAVNAAEPVWEWAVAAGGSGEDIGSGVAVDGNGSIYFSGFAPSGRVGTTTLPSASFFWAKLNSTGGVTTVRTGAGQNSGPNSAVLRIAPDGSLICSGMYSYNLNLGSLSISPPSQSQFGVYVARFNSSLQTSWLKGGILGSDLFNPPAVGADGSVVIGAGFTYALIDQNEITGTANSWDMLVVKFASNGQMTWMKRGGGTESDSAGPTTVDADGNVYVAGTAFSSPFVFGSYTVSPPQLSATMLLKLNKDGAVQWSRSFENTPNANGYAGAPFAVAGCSNGDVIIGGSSAVEARMYPMSGSASIFARYSPSGTLIWTKPIPNLLIKDIAVDSTGNILVLGNLRGSITLGGRTFTSRALDIFVGLFDPSGSLLWGKLAGGAFDDFAGQIARGSDGAIYVAGTLREGGSFDSIFLEGRGQGDAFIAKLTDPVFFKLPMITAQPRPELTYFGGVVTFSVIASNSTSIAYQWFFNDTPLSGQTNSVLTMSGVKPINDGYYYVELKNEFGVVRSDSVRLLVKGDVPVLVTTLAGTNVAGYVDSVDPRAVRFSLPDSPAVLPDGTVFIPDVGNNVIRILEPNGTVGTFAGKVSAGLSNGPASVALFSAPIAMARDAGWDLYVADSANNVVRKISAFGAHTVTTLVGNGQRGLRNGAAADAEFDFPNDLVVDEGGNVFVTEFQNHTVRRIGKDGTVTTFAGTGVAGYRDGSGGQAMFNGPAGIARDSSGNLYVTDWNNDVIRKITPAGVVSTIAGTPGVNGLGDGPALSAKLFAPNGITLDGNGNIFFTEWNNSVRQINAAGEVLTLVGMAGEGFADGGRTNAMMSHPSGIVVYPDGSLIVTDFGNNAIRKVTWKTNAAPMEASVIIELNPSITIFGIAGRTYSVQASENLVAPEWVVLGEVTLVAPMETWYHSQPVTRGQRYYRAVLKN